MSYIEQLSITAGADLNSDQQYHAIGISGTIVATSAATFGLLQNKPKNAEDAALGFLGRSRFRAGAAVAKGAAVMVTTSGWLITATSGTYTVGKALEAVSSGGIGEGVFNFSNNFV